MAKITHHEFFTTNPVVWEDQWKRPLKVGHNRHLSYDPVSKIVTYHLHGRDIVKAWRLPNGQLRVRIDTCGWWTTTTFAAIRDFFRAWPIDASISRAGGKITLRVRDETHTTEHDWFEFTY